MAYSKGKTEKSELKDKDEELTGNPDQDLVEKYHKEWQTNYDVLSTYHVERFDKNYRMFSGNTTTYGTDANMSDPVATELIERVNQKIFEREPKFYVQAPGHNLPKEVTSIITGTAQYFWTNQDVVQSTGTAKAKTKVLGREFLITGNAGTETYFNVGADAPDFRVIPIEDVIFDASKSLKTSPFYYIRQFVDITDLEKLAEVEEDGKVTSGLFKNIDGLKSFLEGKDGKLRDDLTDNQVNRTTSDEFRRVRGQVELITRWEGKKCCRIADWQYVIQEYENETLDDDPLDFAMDIEVPKEPYGLSLLDAISGLITAKNLMLSQIVDFGARALNPPLFVDPNQVSSVNRQTLRNAFKIGGIVMAAPGVAQHYSYPPMPSTGFDLMTYIQQRAESTTGIGAYTGGVPNQTNDKTAGTKGGILALIEQAASPIKDRQQNLEESIVEPVINKMLKTAGRLMSDKETKYVLITGESPKWVKVTKGILTGKITLTDLLTTEIIDEETFAEIAQEMLLNGKDPRKDLVFDVDWIVRVEAGSMAETDSEQERQALQEWVAFNSQFGVPMDFMKVSKEMGIKAGIKEPEQYLIEQQPGVDPAMQQQQMQMEMQGQMQQQQMQQQQEIHQQKVAQEAAKTEGAKADVVGKKAQVIKKLQPEPKRI